MDSNAEQDVNDIDDTHAEGQTDENNNRQEETLPQKEDEEMVDNNDVPAKRQSEGNEEVSEYTIESPKLSNLYDSETQRESSLNESIRTSIQFEATFGPQEESKQFEEGEEESQGEEETKESERIAVENEEEGTAPQEHADLESERVFQQHVEEEIKRESQTVSILSEEEAQQTINQHEEDSMEPQRIPEQHEDEEALVEKVFVEFEEKIIPTYEEAGKVGIDEIKPELSLLSRRESVTEDKESSPELLQEQEQKSEHGTLDEGMSREAQVSPIERVSTEVDEQRSDTGGRESQTLENVRSIEDVQNMMNDRSTLISWCIKMGLIVDGHLCANCKGATRWEVQNDHRLYCVCASNDPRCENMRVKGKIPFNCQGLTINKMTRLLFMIYNQYPLDDVLRDTKMRKEDYESFVNTFREACIYACKKQSDQIGGENVHVNVEIGQRMGRNKATQTVIGGIEEGGKIFFGQLPPDKHLDELKIYLKKKILPGSVVNTNTADRSLLTAMEWNYSESWTLKYNTGCLAEDLWRQHLTGHENEFEALAQTVSEYFVHHRTKHRKIALPVENEIFSPQVATEEIELQGEEMVHT